MIVLVNCLSCTSQAPMEVNAPRVIKTEIPSSVKTDVLEIPHDSDYLRSTQNSESASLEKFVLKPQLYQRTRGELTSLGVREIDPALTHGVRVYEIRTSDSASSLLVKPKLVLRSSLFSEKTLIEPIRNSNDLSISVSIAFADGMISELPSGVGTQALPQEILIPDPTQLIADVTARTGSAPVFLSRIPCPERMRILLDEGRDNSHAFPIQFSTHLISCPINQFFQAKLVMTRDHWKTMRKGFLRVGALEVESELDLTPSLTTEFLKVNVSQSTAHNFILHQPIEWNVPQAPKVVQQVLGHLVAEIKTQLQIEYPDEQFISFKESITADFFERTDVCQPGDSVCFNLRPFEGRVSRSPYTFTLKKDEYLGRPLFLRLRSTLTDDLAERHPIQIRASRENPLNPVTFESIPELSNTMQTISDGDVLEFTLETLSAGTIGQPPVVRVEQYNYCRDPYQACFAGRYVSLLEANAECKTTPGRDSRFEVMNYMRAHPGSFQLAAEEWERVLLEPRLQLHHDPDCSANFFEYIYPLPKVPYRIGGPFPFPYSNTNYYTKRCRFECTRVVDNHCNPEDLERRWRRTTTFSVPIDPPNLTVIPITEQRIDAILSGLSLQFRWTENGNQEELSCPITSLPVERVPNNRVLVTLRNTAQCAPFNAANRRINHSPALAILNRSFLPYDYKCGTLVEDSTGLRNYRCVGSNGQEELRNTTTAEDNAALAQGNRIGIYRRFYPRLQIQTRMRNVGSYFQTGAEIENLNRDWN